MPELPLSNPVPEMLYVLFADGTLGRITARGKGTPALTGGTRFVTQEEYEERRDRTREQHNARVEEMLAIEEQRHRGQEGARSSQASRGGTAARGAV